MSRLGILAWVVPIALAARPANGGEIAPPTRADCAACHEKEAGAFAELAHGRAMTAAAPDQLDRSCAICHAVGASHAADPSKANVTRRPPDAACVTCHSATGHVGSGAAHTRARVGCLDCHASGHAAAKPFAAPLLLAPPRELCAKCHPSEARSFAQPYAHRQGADAMACTACHSVHGDGRTGRLSLLGKGAVCAGCHMEKTEPHVYPHPPRAAAGCLSCHVAHGSTNPRLLTRRNAAAACLECHANVPHDLSNPRYRSCVTCHTAIHGSNRDPLLRDE